MKDIKNKIKKKLSSLGFDIIGFIKPEVSEIAKNNYKSFKIQWNYWY